MDDQLRRLRNAVEDLIIEVSPGPDALDRLVRRSGVGTPPIGEVDDRIHKIVHICCRDPQGLRSVLEELPRVSPLSQAQAQRSSHLTELLASSISSHVGTQEGIGYSNRALD